MNEQFFVTQNNECVTEKRIIGLFGFLTVLCITVSCASAYIQTRQMNELTKENRSLKTLILRRLDKAFVRFMKNGNESEEEYEQ